MDFLSFLGLGSIGAASGVDGGGHADIKIRVLNSDGIWRVVEVCSGDAMDEVAKLMDLDLRSWRQWLIEGERAVIMNRIGANGLGAAVVARINKSGQVQVAFGKSNALPGVQTRDALRRLVG